MAKKAKTKKKIEESPKVTRRRTLVRVAGLLTWLLPYFIFTALIFGVFPARDSSFAYLGMVGCFFLGFAGFVAVGSLDHSAFGFGFFPSIFLAAFSIGAALVAASAVLLYVPQVYDHFDDKMDSFYFLSWGVLLLTALAYLLFRPNITALYRRRGLSRTRIKSLKKGKRNFWWLEALQQEHSLGLLYYFNKAFTVLYLITVIAQASLGWWKWSTVPLAALIALCAVLIGTMLLISAIKSDFEVITDQKNGLGRLGIFSYLICVGFLIWVAITMLQKLLWLWNW